MTTTNFSIAEHDWQSEAYVDEWINRDIQRDGERRPRLKHMLSFAQTAKDAFSSASWARNRLVMVSRSMLGAYSLSPNGRSGGRP